MKNSYKLAQSAQNEIRANLIMIEKETTPKKLIETFLSEDLKG